MAAATPEGASFFFGAVAPQLAHRLAAAGTGFFLAAASLRVGVTSLFRADVCAPSTASVGAGVSARLGAGDCLRRAARMANTMMAETAETASMTRAVPVGGPSARESWFDRRVRASAAAFADFFFDALGAFFVVPERGTGTSSSSSSRSASSSASNASSSSLERSSRSSTSAASAFRPTSSAVSSRTCCNVM